MSTEPNAVRPKTTKAERESLEKLIRQTAGVAKCDAEARGKLLLAHAEAQLSARFKHDDELFARVTKRAAELIAAADAEIAAICRREGIRDVFRPTFTAGSRRGELESDAADAAFQQLADEGLMHSFVRASAGGKLEIVYLMARKPGMEGGAEPNGSRN